MNKSLTLRILSLVFAAVMLLSLAACGGDDGKSSANSTDTRQDTSDGTGTAENGDDAKAFEQNADGLYMITSADDLIAFRDLVDEEIKANIERGNNNNPGAEVGAILMADIDLSELCGEGIGNWRPIGITLNEEGYDVRGYYCGTFDGNGHSISGLYIKTEDSGGGFFGALEQATVSNLTFKNCTLDCKYGLNDGKALKNPYFGTGAVAMYQIGGDVVNCATDENSTVKGKYSVGGLVGLCDQYSKIESCKNYASVNSSENGSEKANVGGIVGQCAGDSRVIGCENYGSVSCVESTFGGIVGLCTGQIFGCINYGDIVNGVDSAANMGGIAGYGNTKIVYCVNAGNIIANGGSAYDIADKDSYVEQCINIGKVIDSSHGDKAYESARSTSCFNLESDSPELTDGTLLEKLADTYWVQGEKFPVWSGKLPY